MRGVGITLQKAAKKKKKKKKKGACGDKGIETLAIACHAFYKLVMVLALSPAAEDTYTVKETAMSNHVAFAPTVSKCCLVSIKRQLNFSVSRRQKG